MIVSGGLLRDGEADGGIEDMVKELVQTYHSVSEEQNPCSGTVLTDSQKKYAGGKKTS